MTKGYWVGAYRHISDPEKLAAYGKLAGPAIGELGGRFLARGGTVEAHEAGLAERTTLIEFDSFEAALAAYQSDAYQRALTVLGDGAERDVRIVEGVG